MEAKNDIIVALEFGTSCIRGIAGCKKTDGSVQILGIEHEDTNEGILKGVIYNIDKTTQAICNIVARLSDKLNMQIYQAYVGIGGQSLHSESNTIKRNLEAIVKITPELTDNIKDNNRQTQYPGAEILDVVAQEYVVGNRATQDPLGVMGDKIEAKFLNIVARTTLRENIEKCMRLAGLNIVGEPIIAPLALAEALLSSNEKRAGCALVDFGAGTTTVQVYKDNILRHLVVLPLGGNNITGDIMNEYLMESDEAERMKRKHGLAYVASPTEKPKQLAHSNGRAVDENELQYTISARQEEIIENAWNQIKAHNKSLLSGIICTGGGANMQDIVNAVQHFSQTEHNVKNAKSLITVADVAAGVNAPMNLNLDTLIALLIQGKAVCVRSLEDAEPIGIQEEESIEEISTPEEKTEQEAAQPAEPAAKQGEEKEEKKPKPSIWKRMGNGLVKGFKLLQEGSEEEEV